MSPSSAAGATGSGKSTILSLLLRLYEPGSGEIFLGGRALRDYNPLWLRRHAARLLSCILLARLSFLLLNVDCCVSVERAIYVYIYIYIYTVYHRVYLYVYIIDIEIKVSRCIHK